MFEQKIKETSVQIYGILHSEARHIKASHHSAICHIFAQPESLNKSWNDLFYIVPILQLTFLWYQNKECGRHETHYNYASPTQQNRTMRYVVISGLKAVLLSQYLAYCTRGHAITNTYQGRIQGYGIGGPFPPFLLRLRTSSI